MLKGKSVLMNAARVDGNNTAVQASKSPESPVDSTRNQSQRDEQASKPNQEVRLLSYNLLVINTKGLILIFGFGHHEFQQHE